MTAADVTVIIPVKPWALSKSRLKVTEGARASLARGFALDVVDAVAGSSRVGQLVLVTAEAELVALTRQMAAVVLVDRPMLSSNGMSDAVAQGRWWASARRPDAPVAVVPGDLPSLTSSVLDVTLDLLAAARTAFVPDAHGQGTTVLWASSPDLLPAAYGRNSASKHAARGARAVANVDPRVRWDVDTAADLAEARRLGIGAHTADALERMATVNGLRQHVRV